MMVGDILKYIPTSTVGKVVETREKDGTVWVKLDNTGLFYDSTYLKPADKSEYRAVSYKEREKQSAGSKEEARAILDEMQKAEEEVSIRDYTPSGGG